MTIKDSFRVLAKILHPDHGGSDESMRALNELYQAAQRNVIEIVAAQPVPTAPAPPTQSRPTPPRPSRRSAFFDNTKFGYQFEEEWYRQYPDTLYPDAVRCGAGRITETYRGRVVSGYGRIMSGLD